MFMVVFTLKLITARSSYSFCV